MASWADGWRFVVYLYGSWAFGGFVGDAFGDAVFAGFEPWEQPAPWA